MLAHMTCVMATGLGGGYYESRVPGSSQKSVKTNQIDRFFFCFIFEHFWVPGRSAGEYIETFYLVSLTSLLIWFLLGEWRHREHTEEGSDSL